MLGKGGYTEEARYASQFAEADVGVYSEDDKECDNDIEQGEP